MGPALTHVLLATAAHADGPALGHLLPVWSVVPFALMLLAIAIMPVVAGPWWEHNRNKAVASLFLGVPVAAWIAFLRPSVLGLVAHEYAAFIILLGSLFVIAGGIVVRGSFPGTPRVITGILGIGALLASVIGTTGASMLLIRPLLRATASRRNRAHSVVFFIFVVSNSGGLLTPLGDPPLFLGFLRGVPFTWTLGLWRPWLLVNVALLVFFFALDRAVFRREQRTQELVTAPVPAATPFQVAGSINFLYLLGVVAVLVASGTLGLPAGIQEGGMLLLAGLSLLTTRRALREENEFRWYPIIEVAVLFAGIFATMMPALAILNTRGAELGLTSPAQYFWASGILSSFLDNAPTYLTFASTASGVVGTDASNLAQLIASDKGAALLAAISMGAVFMGANTYIGNGPNFMVKAIAEQAGVPMPSFFRYMAYSVAILVPLFLTVTWVFLV
jgi:Na+/H+ antiporter NhaD/arsenite permease-like protein